MVHHFRKSKGKGEAPEIAGSFALQAWWEQILYFERKMGQNFSRVAFASKDAGPSPALCARMSETVPPPEFIVEGETGR